MRNQQILTFKRHTLDNKLFVNKFWAHSVRFIPYVTHMHFILHENVFWAVTRIFRGSKFCRGKFHRGKFQSKEIHRKEMSP